MATGDGQADPAARPAAVRPLPGVLVRLGREAGILDYTVFVSVVDLQQLWCSML
jgi:hypothetical protein